MGISIEKARALGIAEEYLTPAEPSPWRPDSVTSTKPGPRAFTGPTPKRSKYRAEATTYGGIRYHSKAEANRAMVLDLDMEAGIVAWWVGQVKFRLGLPEAVYVVDFLVVMADGSIHAEDVKGVELPAFRKNKKLWARYGPRNCPLHVVKRGRLVETITPGEDA
jgi:hypothetical protein